MIKYNFLKKYQLFKILFSLNFKYRDINFQFVDIFVKFISKIVLR